MNITILKIIKGYPFKLKVIMFKKSIQIGNYKVELLKKISEGAYGFVYLVEDVKNPGHKYALKKIIAQNQERKNLADKELIFLKENSFEKNNYFIQYLDSQIITSKRQITYFILMEFGSYGTLFDLIASRQAKNISLTEGEILKLTKAINNGLMLLHSKNIVHCDLKIENLLFYDFDTIKMCDFGSINTMNIDFTQIPYQEYDKYIEIFEKQTTFMYRPPEMCDPYLGYKVNSKVDMWQLGGVIFTLMFFRHPFVECSKMGIINASFFWPLENQYSQKMEVLVRNLLTPNPDLRISSFELDNILNNWHNINRLELNVMAKQIKMEHNKRQGHAIISTNPILKNQQSQKITNDEIDFDFSGLNKMSKNHKSKSTNMLPHKPQPTQNFQFDFNNIKSNKDFAPNLFTDHHTHQQQNQGFEEFNEIQIDKHPPLEQKLDFLDLNDNTQRYDEDPNFLSF